MIEKDLDMRPLMRAEEIGLAALVRSVSTWGTVHRMPVTKISVDFGSDEYSRQLLRGARLYDILIDDR